MSGWFYFALFLLMANLTAMFVFYVRMKNRFSEKRILADIKNEVEQLITDLGRETDRDVDILENRIHSLRELMDEADRRILMADREEKKREAQPVIPERPRDTKLVNADTQKPVDKNPGQKESREQNDPITIYTRAPITRSNREIPIEVPVREQVISMAKKNLSPEMIAKTTGISLGEVELILTMNNSSL